MPVYGPRVPCIPWQPGNNYPAAGEVTCVDTGECVMKSMAGRDRVGDVFVHETHSVYMSWGARILLYAKICFYFSIITTKICMYICTMMHIFVCYFSYLLTSNAIFFTEVHVLTYVMIYYFYVLFCGYWLHFVSGALVRNHEMLEITK